MLILLTAFAGCDPTGTEAGSDRLTPTCAEACGAQQAADHNWDTTMPRGKTREIDFTTSEGTWMSVDVSPDGEWIAFDLMGHVYRMPVSGGEADCLTQDSGIALNFHPRFSPDGTEIAFVSDRSGQNSLWVVNADGSDPRQVFFDRASRIAEPRWTPDGRHIIAVRGFATPGRGWHRVNTQLWMFPTDGGVGSRLISGTAAQYNGPGVSPDGARVYFHVSFFTPNRYGLQVGHRIERIDLGVAARGGELDPVLVAGVAPESGEYGFSFRGPDPSQHPDDVTAYLAPEPSPDGRHIAFIREIPGETFEWRGHGLEPRTALWVKDLETGEERQVLSPVTKDLSGTHAMYSYRVFPGYAWTPDSGAIVLAHRGGIYRVAVATGGLTKIPFSARVKRTISGQVRGRVKIDDEQLRVRFPQWPASSPDGSRLVFTALGELWIKVLPEGIPKRSVEPERDEIFLTPSWAPDGQTVVYATWSDRERGHIWTVSAHGGTPVQITDRAGEYIHPIFSADGNRIVAVSGSNSAASWDAWASTKGWSLVTWPRAGGDKPRTLAQLGVARRPHIGPDGRIHFEKQDDPGAAAALYRPFPPASALGQIVELRSVAIDGKPGPVEVTAPSRRFDRGSNDLQLSPDGRHVAFTASTQIFVADIAELSWRDGVAFIDPDPNLASPGVKRVSRQGGAYHRWRDADTLEYFSGPVYEAYHLSTGETERIPVDLVVSRHGGASRIAFQNARIITLDDDRVIERGNLVVVDSRIACVGECDLSDADRIIDTGGMTIIPGLIDVHTHETVLPYGIVPQHLPSYAVSLAYGVTTILDPAGLSSSSFPLAESVEAGKLLGPRTFSVGELVVSPGLGFGDQLDIETFDEALSDVQRRVTWGAISIKNFRQGRRDQTQKVVEAARRLGVTVTGEGGPLYFEASLIMDGQTGWEHMIAPLPQYQDVARFFGRAEAHYSPTVSVAGHPTGAVDYFRAQHDLAADPKYSRFVPMSEIAIRMARTEELPGANYSFPIIAEGLHDIIKEGGRGAIGAHSEQNGIGSHWEVWAYASVLEPLDALRVGSLYGAHFHGLEKELGSIEAGKIADLIVLTANPLEDIRNTLEIEAVMKAGRLYDADSLDELWPGSEPYGTPPWLDR